MKTLYFSLFTVFISLSSVAQTTIQIRLNPSSEDAHASDFYPSTNFGDFPWMGPVTWTIGGEKATSRAFYRFPVTNIPANAEIVSAKLSLFYNPDNNFNSPDGGHSSLSNSNESIIYRVTGPWFERELTWNNQPDVDYSVSVYMPESTDHYQDYTDMDVTELLQASRTAGDQSFNLRLSLIKEQFYAALIFATSDDTVATRRPLLEVTYIVNSTGISDRTATTNLTVSPNPSSGIISVSTDFSGYDRMYIM
ncbi:MAG: DNRLRE domain-containing protein, partial [Bacteroidota bacterium]